MAEIKIYAKPSNLYRYRKLGDKLDQEVGALLGGYIYCPSIQSMNDPMEGTHRMSQRFLEGPGGSVRQRQVRAALDGAGIASLSEVFDHEPMWAHYADQFKGMCIQYNMNALLRGLDDDVTLTRMIYSEQEPILLSDRATPFDRARQSLSSKTVRWSGEREWRIFRSGIGEARYGEEKPVKKIFLGSRVSEEDERRLVQVGRQLGVQVVKMEIQAYAMKFAAVRGLPRKVLVKRASALPK
jgi:Protein of unknown function (DUF2971)